MNKAEIVFNKIALSSELIFIAAKKSRKLVKSLTDTHYKPKSFEEFRKIQDIWSRKMDQRNFLEEATSKLKSNKQNKFNSLRKLLLV